MKLTSEMLSKNEYYKITHIAKDVSTKTDNHKDVESFKLIYYDEINDLLGVLKTFADSLGFEEKRLEAVKGILTRSLWDWYLGKSTHGIDKANWILARAEEIKAVIHREENDFPPAPSILPIKRKTKKSK